MLRSVSDLYEFSIRATDGDIGHVRDFFFDDRAWAMRYLVVDTGSWLVSRKVLVSPLALGQANWTEKVLPVSVSRAQVKASPDIDTEKPVSRQHEMEYLGYYGYPYYWGGSGLWGMGEYPAEMMTGAGALAPKLSASVDERDLAADRARAQRYRDEDPHLRSARAVMTYRVHASDGEIGHVAGMLVDDENWAIRYLVIDTSNWWMGHKVLVAPQWIHKVSWLEAAVHVDMTRAAIKGAPLFETAQTLDREREERTYSHYGRKGYWVDACNRENETVDSID